MSNSNNDFINQMFGLQGKVAIVTGSTGGLGYAMAKSLLQSGATVVINGRTEDRIIASRDSLYAETGKTSGVIGIRGDMSILEDAKTLVEKTIEATGRIDIIVNNAGINLTEGPFERSTLADWQKISAVNCGGPINLTNAALPYLKQSPAGRVINLTSIGAHTGLPNNTLYTMTKGAMLMFTKSLASELGNTNVRVNSISPGVFTTPMNAKFSEDTAKQDAVVQQIPMGRMGLPGELGGIVVYLASEAATYTHGADFSVDGGFLCA
eukprot:CAMPEP_0176184338 /NCGR_PEP_ID=MMETSP0121_2-20121125/765_1 /TAXON_ID=160619 /ORGANISM="Kryptoperidinium foliaceum, Strain CCMP 1326" /LENGTH=265 /DNA_ID=CAMNT_0017522713 /DNA_START=13 /DNA_END=810 /DNA_ORIENTATION=-